MSVSKDYSEVIGETILEDSDIYITAEHLTKDLDWQQSNILAFFTDEKKQIKQVIDFGGRQATELEAKILATEAIKNNAKEIYIASKPAGFTREEYEIEERNPIFRFCTPCPTIKVLYDEELIKTYALLSVELKKKGVILGDIVHHKNGGSNNFSDNISRDLFPGFPVKLSPSYVGHFSIKDNAHQHELFWSIKDKNRSAKEDVTQNMHALLLNNQKEIINFYDVPVDNNHLIPGIVTQRNCLFDLVFEQAIKDNAASIVLIQHTDKYEVGMASVEDCAILSKARKKSADYQIPLTDYLILGSYIPAKQKYSFLSFAETYGMK